MLFWFKLQMKNWGKKAVACCLYGHLIIQPFDSILVALECPLENFCDIFAFYLEYFPNASGIC